MWEQPKIGKYIMSLLPDKNLFIVTSALNTGIGIIDPDTRYQQTVEGLKNLREKCPNDIILFADGSPNLVKDEYVKGIGELVNINAYFGAGGPVQEFASTGRKSEAEVAMLFYALVEFKRNPDFAKMLSGVKRIFKYSARSILNDNFDISKYENQFGKYVFKKSIPSWMDEHRKTNITDHLYITRFYSMCPSLLDNYLDRLQVILRNIQQHSIDTEHAHYMCLDKRYVVEFDTIGVEGIMGGTGQREIY